MPTKKAAKAADYILTAQQVEFFWTRLAYWQQRLGLMDWRITRSAKRPAKTMLCQMVQWDEVQRQVSCRLNDNWGPAEKPSNKLIDQTACHEMLHLLLHPVLSLSITPGAEQADIDGAEHGVINKLEQIFVPD